jgi:hypothetical protein
MNDKQKAVKENIVEIIKAGLKATGDVELTNYEIEQVLSNIYPKSKTNERGQPIGDYPTDIPTQEQFDEHHSTPQDYGEEAEWIMVSKKFTQEEALALIQAKLKDEWGWTGGDDGEMMFPNDLDDLQSFDIGYGYDRDSYHYSEGCYWICSADNEVTKRYEAWGIATQ